MTTAGIRIRDSSETVVFDDSVSSIRILGTQTITANSSGSLTSTALGSGTPFAIVYPVVIPDDSNYDFSNVAVTSSEISWTSAACSSTVIYGVYAGTSATASIASGAGFRFTNSEGVDIIDGTNHNLFFASKQTISMSRRATLEITVAAAYPMVAFRGSGLVGVVKAVPNSDNTWTITLMAHSILGASGTIYIFDTVSHADQMWSGAAGIRLRNASGEVIFDSRYKSASVTGTGLIDLVAPAYVTETTLSADNQAIILSCCLFTIQVDISLSASSGGEGGIQTSFYIYCAGGGVDGTTLTTGGIASIYETNEDPVSWTDSSINGQYLLVDVSNL